MIKNIYVAKSAISGKGVFAKRDFKKGDIISFFKGKPMTFFVHNKKDALSGQNWLGVGRNRWIDSEQPLVYINHSCNPNTSVKGKVTLVALRNIEKNTEITMDYAVTEGDLLWEMKEECCCGEKNCRKIIRSIQYLPKKIFNKYMPNVPTYFKKIYVQSHRK